jgi:hypothetical protein
LNQFETDKPSLRDPWPLFAWMRVFLTSEIVVYTALFILSGLVILFRSRMVFWDSEQLQRFTLVLSYTQVLNLALFILTIVLAGRLTYRTMKNAHVLGGERPRISPAWAVGWYLVPLANLAMPPRAIQQIWTATFGDGAEAQRRSHLIASWWAMSLLSIVMHQIALREILIAWPSADWTSGPSVADFAGPLSYALAALGAVLFLRIFALVSRAQQILITRAPTAILD